MMITNLRSALDFLFNCCHHHCSNRWVSVTKAQIAPWWIPWERQSVTKRHVLGVLIPSTKRTLLISTQWQIPLMSDGKLIMILTLVFKYVSAERLSYDRCILLQSYLNGDSFCDIKLQQYTLCLNKLCFRCLVQNLHLLLWNLRCKFWLRISMRNRYSMSKPHWNITKMCKHTICEQLIWAKLVDELILKENGKIDEYWTTTTRQPGAWFAGRNAWSHVEMDKVSIRIYSISQEICTRFLLCCALLWLYIDWFSHIHQAYFTGTVAI